MPTAAAAAVPSQRGREGLEWTRSCPSPGACSYMPTNANAACFPELAKEGKIRQNEITLRKVPCDIEASNFAFLRYEVNLVAKQQLSNFVLPAPLSSSVSRPLRRRLVRRGILCVCGFYQIIH